MCLTSCAQDKDKKSLRAENKEIDKEAGLAGKSISIRLSLFIEEGKQKFLLTTFADVEPIFKKKCSTCHVIEDDLKTSDIAAIRRIIRSVEAGADSTDPLAMPPPAENPGLRLTEDEVFLLKSWAFDGGLLSPPAGSRLGFRYQVKAKANFSDGKTGEFELSGSERGIFGREIETAESNGLTEIEFFVFSEFGEPLYAKAFRYGVPQRKIQESIHAVLCEGGVVSQQA